MESTATTRISEQMLFDAVLQTCWRRWPGNVEDVGGDVRGETRKSRESRVGREDSWLFGIDSESLLNIRYWLFVDGPNGQCCGFEDN